MYENGQKRANSKIMRRFCVNLTNEFSERTEIKGIYSGNSEGKSAFKLEELTN
jgi:hypothetical protein